MPSGPVHHEHHQRYIPLVVVLGVVVGIGGILGGNWYVVEGAVWFVFWYWMGRYIDPDLDLQGVTMAEGRMLRELDILGVFLVPFTAFYAAMIGYIIRKLKIRGAIGGSHRTWLTHSLFPGTVGRQLLLWLVIGILISLINQVLRMITGGEIKFFPLDILAFVIGQFLGLGVGDLIHIWLDNHYSE